MLNDSRKLLSVCLIESEYKDLWDLGLNPGPFLLLLSFAVCELKWAQGR